MWSLLEKQDFNTVTQYLQNNSPFTCPIYGNISSAGYNYRPIPMRSGLFYVYKTDDDKICGIIASFNDGNVMTHTTCMEAKEDILSIILRLPFHSVWGLDGTLPDRLKLSEKANISLDSRILNVMVLNKAKEDNDTCDGLEFIRIDRRFLLPSYIGFIKKCLWEGFGFRSNILDIRKRIRERTQLEPYWFLSHDNKFVAQVHIQAMTAQHGYIGGVCTLRNYRREGFARKIMQIACDFITEEGRIPALAVSSANQAANSLYDDMGFIKIGTTLVYMKEREFKGDENKE